MNSNNRRSWIFPYEFMYGDPSYERIFKIGKVISWIISINTETEDDIKLFDVGDEVYLWWPSKEHLDLPLVKEGIFSLAHIVTKPKKFLFSKPRSSNELIPRTANLQKLNDGDVVYNQKRMKGVRYYNKYEIELIIDKIKVDESFFDNSILNNDPVFSDLKLSPHDSCTYYLISENQSDKLKILLENSNSDQTALNVDNENIYGQGHLSDPREIKSIETHIKADGVYLQETEKIKVVERTMEVAKANYLNEDYLDKKVKSAQGYLRDPEKIKKVELCAMELAIKHYQNNNYKVEVTGAYESYDLSCMKEGIERRVEVKGTTTQGASVILTKNEVDHVLAKKIPVDLFLVSEIVVEERADGLKASGGKRKIIENWMPAIENLTIKTYDYKIP